MRNYILAALLAGTLTAPAFAQVGGPFSGFRVEGVAGYDALRSGDDKDDAADTNDDEGDETINGVAYGIGLGYDFDLGSMVVGAEAEYSDSTGKQDFNENIDVPITGRIATGRDLYVGGRIGFPIAPTTLVYGKLGYTNTAIDGAFSGGNKSFDLNLNAEGYRLGAGIEQLLGPNAYGKIEYRYSNYGNLETEGDDFFDDGSDLADIDLDRHQVLVGLGFRF
jgi:outer membrane immunogenic protein